MLSPITGRVGTRHSTPVTGIQSSTTETHSGEPTVGFTFSSEEEFNERTRRLFRQQFQLLAGDVDRPSPPKRGRPCDVQQIEESCNRCPELEGQLRDITKERDDNNEALFKARAETTAALEEAGVSNLRAEEAETEVRRLGEILESRNEDIVSLMDAIHLQENYRRDATLEAHELSNFKF